MKKFIQRFLNKKGYHLFKEGFMPKGIYFESDLTNLIHIEKVKLVMDVGAYQGLMTRHFLKVFS